MITRSRELSLKLVYQLTHKTMICRSKCRPLNTSSIGANRCISSSSLATSLLHQSRPQEQESARSDHSPAALPETIGNYWLLRKTILERFSPVYANCALSLLGVSMMDCPSAVSKVESPWANKSA